MLAPDKGGDSRLMTMLVQLASWASGATAVAVLALALWPKASVPLLSSPESPATQGAWQDVTTPAEPEIQILDKPAPKPYRQLEKPPPQAPIAY
jgi:hypothetical protein